MPEQPAMSIDSHLRALQIIVIAMAIGVILFAVIALIQAPFNEQGTPQALHLALWIVAASSIPIYIVLAGPVASSARHRARQAEGGQDPPGDPLKAIRIVVIMRAAIAEGVALFALVVYLLSAHPVSMAVAGLGLFGILLAFPRASVVGQMRR